MKFRYPMAFAVQLMSVSVMPAVAADLSMKWELPQLNVAEYHRPYVSFWLERNDQTMVTTLAVLYDLKKKDNGGTKWLKDMRQWWRKGGRDLQVPADGITGATRAPGEQTINFAAAKPIIDKLPAGEYQIVVEAAREGGGREVVRVPFTWPSKTTQTHSAKGIEELGAVSLQIKP